jgi:alpha-amylase
MERFFDALERNADWLSTTTPSDWLAGHRPIGRVYVPTGSYVEMTEWALPPKESVVFSEVLHRAIDERRPEARFLHGGFWRNFQVRYREINDLHKQMLRASAAVDEMPEGPARTRARDHLYQGQSNDCFWHGLFGGIYISHMRLATYEHLIAAEDLADAALGAWSRSELADLDLDGRDEALLESAGQVVTVKLDDGAGIGSWDVRATRHALTAVLRRRPEASHERLRAHDAAVRAGRDDESKGTTSIHELVHSKEPNLAGRLVYDDHERRSGLVRFLGRDTTPADLAAAREHELGDFLAAPFELVELVAGRLVVARDGTVATTAGPAPVRVVKTLTLGGDRLAPTLRLDVDVENRSAGPVDARLGLEWSTTMLGGGGNPAAWWESGGDRVGHDTAGSVADVTAIAQGNEYIGIAVRSDFDPQADAWWFPIETISMSEAGFERVYQGSCLLVSWPIALEPGGRTRVTVTHHVTAARDRAAEEAAATVVSEP